MGIPATRRRPEVKGGHRYPDSRRKEGAKVCGSRTHRRPFGPATGSEGRTAAVTLARNLADLQGPTAMDTYGRLGSCEATDGPDGYVFGESPPARSAASEHYGRPGQHILRPIGSGNGPEGTRGWARNPVSGAQGKPQRSRAGNGRPSPEAGPKFYLRFPRPDSGDGRLPHPSRISKVIEKCILPIVSGWAHSPPRARWGAASLGDGRPMTVHAPIGHNSVDRP